MAYTMFTKDEMFEAGKRLVHEWCMVNNVLEPRIRVDIQPTMFDTCAYYRNGEITIWPNACARIGVGGR